MKPFLAPSLSDSINECWYLDGVPFNCSTMTSLPLTLTVEAPPQTSWGEEGLRMWCSFTIYPENALGGFP